MVTDEIQKMLEDAAPEASRIYLKEYLNLSDSTISDIDLLFMAIEAVDSAKRPSAKKHKNALKAIGWLLSLVDEQESNKGIVTDWYLNKIKN